MTNLCLLPQHVVSFLRDLVNGALANILTGRDEKLPACFLYYGQDEQSIIRRLINLLRVSRKLRLMDGKEHGSKN